MTARSKRLWAFVLSFALAFSPLTPVGYAFAEGDDGIETADTGGPQVLNGNDPNLDTAPSSENELPDETGPSEGAPAGTRSVTSAEVGDYETLMAALESAADGATIALTADIDATGKTQGDTGHNLWIGSGVTIDGNGYTLTVDGAGVGIQGGSADAKPVVALNNIKVVNASGGQSQAIDVRGPVSLSISGGQDSKSELQGLRCVYFAAGSASSDVTLDQCALKCIVTTASDAETSGVVYPDGGGITVTVANCDIEYSATGNKWLGLVNTDNVAAGDSFQLHLTEGNSLTVGSECYSWVGNFTPDIVYGEDTVIYGNLDSDQISDFNLGAKEGYALFKAQDGEYRFGEAVAYCAGAYYQTFEQALAASYGVERFPVEILKAGTYTLPGKNRWVRIVGAVDGVVFEHTGTGSIASYPNGATFENVTFKLGKNNYHGFQHAGPITMKGCTINGKLFSYGDMNFENCTFNAPGVEASGVASEDYSMWTYSGNITYTDCTFNGAGKFLNVYNESGATLYEVTANNCTFNSTKSNKAAFNVKETSGSNVLQYTVSLNGCTTNENFPETSESDTLTVISGLVQVDDRVKGGTANGGEIIVNVDGQEAYRTPEKPYVAKIGDVKYDTLQAAIDAAYEMTGDVTITLGSDIEGYSIVRQKAGLNLTIDGAGKKLVGNIVIDGAGRSTGAETLTIQKVNFEGDTSNFCSKTDAFVAVPSLKTSGTPYYTNGNNYAHNITVRDCAFTSTSANDPECDVVGFKSNSGGGSAYNVTLDGVTGTSLHSLAQFTGTTGATITSCTVTGGESGVNINGGSGDYVLSGNTFTSAEGASGYGVRLKANSGAVVRLDDTNTITAKDALVLGKNDASSGSYDVTGGRYSGNIVDTNTGTGKFEISGGLFTVAPTLEQCAEGVYPIANTDEATKADFPYTVGAAVASITSGDPAETTYYTTFASAAEAAGDNVVTLLADIDDAYTLESGTLKVKLDGKALTVNAPEGKILKSETKDGVTTYTSADPVAQIGENKYASLKDAVAAVTDGTPTTITMIGNEAINVVGSAITINAGRDITIDLNGHEVVGVASSGSTSALITNKGTLTIKDGSEAGTGKLISGATETWIYDGSGNYAGSYASNTITNSGTVTVESGYIENLSTGSATYAIDNNSSAADAIANIKGGTVKAHSVAIRQFANSATKENTVNVSGGTVEAGYSGMWIQLPGSDASKAMKAALNVTGGTLKGGSYAFYDYTFGNNYGATQYTLSGGTFDGYIFSYGANVTISDGDFKGDVAIKQGNAPSEVSVTGGHFAGDVYTYSTYASEGFITGGTFTSLTYVDDDGETKDNDWMYLLADGYTYDENEDGEYVVREAHFVAQVGEKKYESFEEAVAARTSDDDVVTLLANIEDEYVLQSGSLKAKLGEFELGVKAPENKALKISKTDDVTVYEVADPVAKIGDDLYASLQDAFDAAHELTGDVTVVLMADIQGYSIVHQKAGLNLTVDGAGKKLNGQIIIDGDGRANGTETLTIKNVKFEGDAGNFYTGTDSFILVPSTKTAGTPYYTSKYNYAHNITVEGCSFTSTSAALDVVAYKANSGGGEYNVSFVECTGTNLHSLAQLTGTTGGSFAGCTVTDSDSFVNISGGGGEFDFTGNSFTSSVDDGYGVRLKDSTTATAVMGDGNAISAATALVLSKKASETGNKGTIKVTGGSYAGALKKITPSEDAKFEISGGLFTEKPAEEQCAEGYAAFPSGDDDYPWTVAKPVTVTFDSAGGSNVPAQTIAKGATATEPEQPAKQGYGFLGWFAGDSETAFDFSTAVNEDLTLTARWSDPVAKIGDTLYASLDDAFGEVEDGDTIELLADVSVDQAIYDDDARFVLDLGGKTVTGRMTFNSGIVEVKNGTIAGRFDVYDSAVVTLAKTATINGQAIVWGDGTFGQSGCKTPTFNVRGKINNTGDSAISTNGTDLSGAKINIYSGAKVTSDDIAIYQPSGNVTISGGTITGATAVYQKAGTLLVSGGMLIANGAAADYSFNGNGANATGDALVVESCNYPYDAPNAMIAGGILESANGKGIGAYTKQPLGELPEVISVTNEITVRDGQIWNAENGAYRLIVGTYVAQISDQMFGTLQAALDAAENGDAVVLLQDVKEDVVYSKEAQYTLDLGGNTAEGWISFFDGTVNIKNGTIAGELDAYDNSTVTLAKDATVNGWAVAWGDGVSGEEDCATPTLNIHGTITNTGNAAIATNGTDKSGAKVNIFKGATVTSTDDIAVYLPSGNVTISGGTITGATAIYQKSGTLTISGGNLIANGKAVEYQHNGNGAYATGDALVVENCNYPNGVPTATITGGIFESANGKQVAAYALDDDLELADVTSATDELSVLDGQAWFEQQDGTFKLDRAVTVTFDAGDGASGAPEAQTIVKGAKVTKPSDPTIEGQLFLGWYAKDAEVEFDFDNTAIDADLTLYAKWGTPVAQVGDAKFASLQAAIDAAHGMTGDVTVTLLDNVTEVAVIHQKAGLNLTVDGAGKTITGQIYVDGDARYNDDDTLTIQNVNFAYDAATYDDAFVDVPSTKTAGKPYSTGKYNYAHNVTVKDCEFAGEGTTTVAVRVASNAGARNVALKNLKVTGGHSFAQLTGVKDLTITDCTATGVKNGINISGGDGEGSITGTTIEAQGYTVRVKEASAMAVALDDNVFSGEEGIVSEATSSGAITVAGGKYAGALPTDGSKFTVSGGLFTVEPAQAVCAEGLSPIANDDPETMDAYPYTVGEVVTVTFDADGGEPVPDAQRITKGSKATQPANPSKAGFAFDGWFEDGSETAFDFTTAIDGDKNLKAHWTEASYSGIKIKGSLSLNERIDMNLYVENLPSGTNPTDYVLKYWMQDDKSDIKEAGLTQQASNYVSVASLAAKQMSDPIHFELTHLDKLVVAFDYSVRDYCDATIRTSNNSYLKALCQAALNYGTYAQKNFNYNTEDLANKNNSATTEADLDITIPDDYKVSISSMDAGISDKVAQLKTSTSLESQTMVNLYITPKGDTRPDDISITLDGVAVDTDTPIVMDGVTYGVASKSVLSDGRVYVCVSGIEAMNLDHMFEVLVDIGGDKLAFTYSALSYAYQEQNSSDVNLAKTCKGLYNYCMTAKEYFVHKND